MLITIRWGKLLPLLLLLVSTRAAFADFTFLHPGLLQNRQDLQRIKTAVANRAEPIFSGFEVFRTNLQSQADYKMRGPLETVGRNPTIGQGIYDSDANAAYQCAIMWTITGDIAYANKSKEIINAWSRTLKSITGRDAVLMAGLGPFKMVNAAEILRYTDAGWPSADIQQAETHFREVIYPVIKDFAPFANGNWDTAAIKTMTAIAVFCNDREMFERAMHYYVDGVGDGRLSHYIVNETGQCQESGRDQQHTQLGLAHLGDCCEIAWHQGLDLYGYDDNLLLKGFEYTAKYNLGEQVPFAETMDRTGKYHHIKISTEGRGRFRSVFEEIYNHYVNRRRLTVPFIQQAVLKVRPEQTGGPGADHVGFGTLLFAQPVSGDGIASMQDTLTAPAGIIAKGSAKKNTLTWVAVEKARGYLIKRSAAGGQYEIVARSIPAASYVDNAVKSGVLYRYLIFAFNSAGKGPDSLPVSVCAGLPGNWVRHDVGSVAIRGKVEFDGARFSLMAAGKSITGEEKQFEFVSRPLKDDGSIAARFIPQTGSQFSQFGLMMRETPDPGAANVALIVSPASSQNIEAPGWRAELVARGSAGTNAVVQAGSEKLAVPAVTFGRLTGSCWMKLKRVGNDFTGFISFDGDNWDSVGTVAIPLKKSALAGLAVCSGIMNVTTTVKFDSVVMSDWGSTPDASEKRGPFLGTSRIQSPDEKVSIDFTLQADGTPAYDVNYLGKAVVLASRLGLEPGFTNAFTIIKTATVSHNETWSPVYGEHKTVPDDYHELTVNLKQASGKLMQIIFRAYDEGVAFRYAFPEQNDHEFHFTGERTEFHFPENTFGYEEHGTEGVYQRTEVSNIGPGCERPLTLEYASGLFASLCEADNEDFPRMLLSPVPGTSNTLVSALGGTSSNMAFSREPATNDPSASVPAAGSTPWRVLVLGEKPGDLLERDYLLLDLNPPLALKDVSWIKPGKAMRDTTLTTTNSKAIIDFAATAGLQYVLLDWKWYGSEAADTGDATTVRAPSLDIPEIINYGREKNVGLILYVDRKQVKKQRDILFPLYEKWGVKGVKIGFVEVGPQTETAWITETIKKAAEHHLLLDIHDGYRPTGFARTYPNLLTVEGIRGNEHFPTPEHNCTVPFTRYVAGSADYTVCYYDHRLKTTHGQQLAMAVVSYSPLQSILWYDRPGMFHGEPEIKFFQKVPTVWDDTRVIAGEIGKYAAIARRSGDDWFIGVINDSEVRNLTLPLSFLDLHKKYLAHIYADDETVSTRTHVKVTTREVGAETMLGVPLQAAGGEAVWLTPSTGE